MANFHLYCLMCFGPLLSIIILNLPSVWKQIFSRGCLDRLNLYVLTISADKTIDGKYDEECIVLAEVNREIVVRAREEFPVLIDRVFRT